MKKKAQLSFNVWSGLLSFAIVMALFGMILTITAGVQEDIKDDQTAGSRAELVANQSLDAQVSLSAKQGTLVTAGIGIFIIGLLISGFAVYRMVQ